MSSLAPQASAIENRLMYQISKNVVFAYLLSTLSKKAYNIVGTIIAYESSTIHQKIKLLRQLSPKVMNILSNAQLNFVKSYTESADEKFQIFTTYDLKVKVWSFL